MALLIEDNHIQYYQVHAIISIQFDHSYFVSPAISAVRVWICIMIKLPDLITLTVPIFRSMQNSFPGW